MRINNGLAISFGAVLSLLIGTGPMLHGANCNSVNVEALKKIILASPDPKAVLVAAAIGQEQVLPALRARMRPGNLSTPEAAAEAAAARLGDQDAVGQLKKLLKKGDTGAAMILGYAGSEQTLRIGFDYLLEHEDSPYVFKVVTDVTESGPGQFFALNAVLRVEGVPSPNDNFSAWIAWWKHNKKTFKVTPPSSLLADATLQCFGRIAEWNIGEGVRELYEAGGKGTLPVIEHYAKLGDKMILFPGFWSIRGSAQAVLAKAGDEGSFKEIAKEFRFGYYSDAIDKLRYIGDSRSLELLVNALDLSFFNVPAKEISNDQRRDVQQTIFHALSSLVKNPPVLPAASPTPENVEIWKTWFQKTKGAIEFNPPPKECIECFDQ